MRAHLHALSQADIILAILAVLSVHPEEWRQKWFTMIPAQRLCDPSELKGVRSTADDLSEAQE